MIAHKVRTNVYLDSIVKEQAKEIFDHYGFSLSDAINMFLTQSVMQRGIPFELKIPNATTIKAMKESKAGVNMVESGIDELIQDMDSLRHAKA